MPSIDYDAPPTVGRFLESDAFVRTIVGPIGSGKSSGCNIEFIKRAAQQKPGPDGIRRTRFAAVRNTYPELRDTTRKTFEQWVPDEFGEWNEQEFTFHMKFNDVESEVLFRALDDPKDVKKLLSLELTGVYFNELREIRREIFDGAQGRVGRFPRIADGGPTWSGVWADTNPWPVGHWGHDLFNANALPDGFEVFEQPDGLGPDAENLANLPVGYYSRMCAGKSEDWIDEYVRAKYPLHDKGSIYGRYLATTQAMGFAHPMDGCFATFDFGISDSTAIWVWRLNGNGSVDFVDWYQDSGQAIAHFFDWLDAKPYGLLRLVIPHDGRARTLVTGTSVMDAFMKRYPGRVVVCPGLSVDDGIEAGRSLLGTAVRFHERCETGLKILKAYKFAFDEKKKVFSKLPLHDSASHTADAFRYVAVFAKVAELLTRQQELPAPYVFKEVPTTMNELWERADRERRAND